MAYHRLHGSADSDPWHRVRHRDQPPAADAQNRIARRPDPVLQRGMSADDIRMVLEASPKNAAKRCRTDSAYGKHSPVQL